MISQTALDHFRTSLSSKKNDPYSVLLRRNKLPMALLDDAANPNLRKVRLFINLSGTLLEIWTYLAFPHRGNGALWRYLWSQGPAKKTENRGWYV